MRRFLLTFLFALFAAVCVQAEEVSVTFSEKGYSNAQEVSSVAMDDYVTLLFDKGTNSNTCKYYNSGTAVRVYGGGTMTVTAVSGYQIKSVTLTTPSGSYSVNSGSTVTNGTLTIDSTETTITDVDAAETKFTQGGTSGQVRIKSVTVVYEATGAPVAVSTPIITPATGEITADTEITIECTTDGASIYYTTDGSEPSSASGTLYAGAFTLPAAGVVKAVAVADGFSDSSVATAEYTFPVANIGEFISEARGYATTISGDVTVVAQSGSYLFVQDETAKMIVYGTLAGTYSNGDVLTGIKGTYSLYNGLPEMTSPVSSSFGEAAAGMAVTPVAVNATEAADTPLLTYIRMDGVSITAVSGKSYTITDGDGNTIELYNTLGIDVPEGDDIAFLGFVSCYKEQIQIMPLEILTADPELPTLSVVGGSEATGAVRTGNTLTITPAENNAVSYSINGGDMIAMTQAADVELPLGMVSLYVQSVRSGKTVDATYYYNVVETVKAALTQQEILDMNYNSSSYEDINVPSLSGYWTGLSYLNKGGYLQLRNKNGEYIQSPVFAGDILAVTVVVNNAVSRVLTLSDGDTKLGTLNTTSTAGEKLTLSFPDGVTSFALTSSSTVQISGFVVEYEKPAAYTLEVSSAEASTLYLNFPVAIPDGVTAYYPSAVNGDVLTFTALEGSIPAYTPVVVEAVQGSYEFGYSDAELVLAQGNMLTGTLEATEIIKEDGYTYYVLSTGSAGVAFYYPSGISANGKFTNAANKAYMKIADAVASSIKYFSLQMNGGTTAIEGVESAGGAPVIYDLAGRRVDAVTAPGVYIVNGKKQIVK